MRRFEASAVWRSAALPPTTHPPTHSSLLSPKTGTKRFYSTAVYRKRDFLEMLLRVWRSHASSGIPLEPCLWSWQHSRQQQAAPVTVSTDWAFASTTPLVTHRCAPIAAEQNRICPLLGIMRDVMMLFQSENTTLPKFIQIVCKFGLEVGVLQEKGNKNDSLWFYDDCE